MLSRFRTICLLPVLSVVSGCDPADAPTPAPPIAAVIPTEPGTFVFETPVFSVGEMMPGVLRIFTAKAKNISSVPQEIENIISDCSCTVPVWSYDPIDPGATTDIEITLDPGLKQGVVISKRITILGGTAPPVSMKIEGSVATILKYGPDSIDSPADDQMQLPVTEIVLESVDGLAFQITSVTPAVALAIDPTPAARKIIQVDWGKWRSSEKPAKFEISTDHPNAPPMTVTIRKAIQEPKGI